MIGGGRTVVEQDLTGIPLEDWRVTLLDQHRERARQKKLINEFFLCAWEWQVYMHLPVPECLCLFISYIYLWCVYERVDMDDMNFPWLHSVPHNRKRSRHNPARKYLY